MGDEEHQDQDDETIGLILSSSESRPHLTPNKKVTGADGISDVEAGFSLAKAIMGAGSFALPWAFSKMGFLGGPLFLLMVMVLSVQTLKILARAAANCSGSYVDLARAAFGSTGARLTYIASISASIGVCGSYLVFIAANLRSLLEETTYFDFSQGVWTILTLPLAVMLSSIRDMKAFAFTSLLGDVSVVLGMAVVLVYGLLYRHDTIGQDCVAFGPLNSIPLALGTIGYLFLVHFLCLPIETSMARPDHFGMVATLTFAACAILSGSFGVISYLLFGTETQQIVLLNVQGSFFVSAVKILLCVDLLLTYPVVMRPSIVIIEQHLATSATMRKASGKDDGRVPSVLDSLTTSGNSPNKAHWMACTGLGMAAAGAAMFVPAFGLLSALVGGVSQAFLAFVMPPTMLAQLQSKRMSLLHGLYVIVGFTMIVWTLYSAIKEIG